MKTAIYPGTFDPVTNGHIDLVRRAGVLFDRVIIAIGENSQKSPLFSLAERMEMIREATSGIERVEVDSFAGLLTDYVTRRNATAVIRGLRAISDFEYEFQIALMNRRLNDRVETVFLLPSEEYVYLTSTIVKEVARYGGNIDTFVPGFVSKKLKERYKNE